MRGWRGAPDGLGNEGAPWNISSALDGKQKVEPGDTIWIHQGRYKAEPKVGGTGFVVRLAGRDGAPVQVRAWKGQRVTMDGGLNIQPPATHVWIWDLEILVSESRPSAPIPPDPVTAPTTTATFYTAVALGDLNKDGKLDLIVAGTVGPFGPGLCHR